MKITRHILQRKECYLSTKDKTGINTPTFITIHETSIGVEKAPANRTIDYYTNLLEHPELRERDPKSLSISSVEMTKWFSTFRPMCGQHIQELMKAILQSLLNVSSTSILILTRQSTIRQSLQLV